jgi:hypothetical protein
MAYSIKDVIGFPPPTRPPRTIDWQSLVNLADDSVKYPIAYAFGGNAPTMIAVDEINAVVTGPGHSMDLIRDSNPNSYGRMFAESRSYYWDPLSPDYNGS